MDETEQTPPKGWTVWKLAILSYIFVSAAAALNIFMLGLVSGYLGLPVLSPVGAILVALLAGLPLSWKTGQWIRQLMDEADDGYS